MMLVISFLFFIGFCASGYVFLQMQEREALVRKRLNAAIGGRAVRQSVEKQGSLIDSGRATVSYLATATRLFGFDLAKLEHYPAQWWMVLIGTLGAAYLLALAGRGVGGNLVLLLVPLFWIGLSRLFFSWAIGRRQDTLFRQFPDALAMIVRSVRVGIPVSEAVRAVGREMQAPTAAEFARLADEISIGTPFDDALFQMAERNGLAEYRFFATALSLQNQTGGALSETLENLADVIRKRVFLRERGRALASEAKTSAGVLAALPPLSAVGLWFLNPAYISILFVDPTGNKVLATAICMLFSGIMVMRMIIRKSLQ